MTARVYRLHTGVDLTKRPEQRWREPHTYPGLRPAAATAAIYAGALGFDAPYDTWTGMSDGRATCLLPDGTRLFYAPDQDGSPSSLTAHRLCPHGRLHIRFVNIPRDLWPFADAVARCTKHLAHQEAA